MGEPYLRGAFEDQAAAANMDIQTQLAASKLFLNLVRSLSPHDIVNSAAAAETGKEASNSNNNIHPWLVSLASSATLQPEGNEGGGGAADVERDDKSFTAMIAQQLAQTVAVVQSIHTGRVLVSRLLA